MSQLPEKIELRLEDDLRSPDEPSARKRWWQKTAELGIALLVSVFASAVVVGNVLTINLRHSFSFLVGAVVLTLLISSYIPLIYKRKDSAAVMRRRLTQAYCEALESSELNPTPRKE